MFVTDKRSSLLQELINFVQSPIFFLFWKPFFRHKSMIRQWSVSVIGFSEKNGFIFQIWRDEFLGPMLQNFCELEFFLGNQVCNCNQACAIQINGMIDRTVILVRSKSHFYVLVKIILPSLGKLFRLIYFPKVLPTRVTVR